MWRLCWGAVLALVTLLVFHLIFWDSLWLNLELTYRLRCLARKPQGFPRSVIPKCVSPQVTCKQLKDRAISLFWWGQGWSPAGRVLCLVLHSGSPHSLPSTQTKNVMHYCLPNPRWLFLGPRTKSNICFMDYTILFGHYSLPWHHHTLEGLLSIPHLCQAHFRSSHLFLLPWMPYTFTGFFLFLFLLYGKWLATQALRVPKTPSSPPYHVTTIHVVYYFISHFYNSAWHVVSATTYSTAGGNDKHTSGDAVLTFTGMLTASARIFFLLLSSYWEISAVPSEMCVPEISQQ